VNCGAIPDSLTENELFGHERGAFTDAREAQPGAIALAEGGTIFFDEVDALSPKAQVALLRFLQDREYRPLGARVSRRADVRVIAATNAELKMLVDNGRLRVDLFYRLNIVSVRLPPLRERGSDVELLADHFLRRIARRHGRAERALTAEARHVLRAYAWPGNARELENILHQAFVLSEGESLQLGTLQDALPPVPNLAPAREAAQLFASKLGDAKAALIADFERRYLAQLLRDTGGNVSEAARRAGKERRALGKLLKKYGLGQAQSPRRAELPSTP
jgi:DNA-binding NtrC family response regulator